MAPQGKFIKSRNKTWQPEGLDLHGKICTRDNVIQAVGFYLNMPESTMFKNSRKRELVDARNYIHYFLSINRDISLAEIGEITGRDHSSVSCSVKKTEERIGIYKEERETVFMIAFYIKWLNQLDMEIKINEVTTQQIRYLYFLLDQLGIRHMKSDLVTQASEGRTESARELKNLEMIDLLNHLGNKLKEAKQDNRPHNQSFQHLGRMRKRILSICYSIGWTRYDPDKRRHQVDHDRLQAWLIKYGYLHKSLNDYTYLELPTLVTQMERLLKSTLDGKVKENQV